MSFFRAASPQTAVHMYIRLDKSNGSTIYPRALSASLARRFYGSRSINLPSQQQHSLSSAARLTTSATHSYYPPCSSLLCGSLLLQLHIVLCRSCIPDTVLALHIQHHSNYSCLSCGELWMCACLWPLGDTFFFFFVVNCFFGRGSRHIERRSSSMFPAFNFTVLISRAMIQSACRED